MSSLGYSRGALILVLLIVYSFAFGQQPQPAEELVAADENDLVLTVRLSPDVKPETIALLNRMTVPRVVHLEKHRNAGVFLSRVYGAYLPRAASELRALNPWLNTNDLNAVFMNDTVDLRLPAGAEYYVNVVKPAAPDLDFKEQALLETGMDSSVVVSQIQRTTDQFKNYFRDYCKKHACTAGQQTAFASQRAIAFPFVSRYVSFTLTDAAKTNSAGLLDQLKQDNGVVEAEIHVPTKLISHVSESMLTALSSNCAAQPPESDWFIRALSFDKLPLDVLRGNNETIIAVMDSGITQNDERFQFWQNIPEANGLAAFDDDGNNYVDDKIGCNFIVQGNFPLDDQFSVKYQNHGTHVTGLASGRFLNEPLAIAVTQRVRAMILKIADQRGSVDNGAVNDAIVYAQNKNVAVVNMSFEGDFSASIKKYIKEDAGRLYVVAAGNGNITGRGMNIDEPGIMRFPAKLAAELSNVISVAAHNEDGSLACFSNFGKTTVDVAAPGVAVQSTVAQNQLAKLSGTSQAAPLVSLTAALIHSQGLLEPALIKQRILVSVDYVPGYKEKLTSEGKLNIAKAVSIFDDVVELNDPQHTLLRGKLISPPCQLTIGGQTIPFQVIRKIVNFPPDEAPGAQRVTWLNQGKLEHLYGSLALPALTLKVGDTILLLAADKIRDVIPAWRTTGQTSNCSNH